MKAGFNRTIATTNNQVLFTAGLPVRLPGDKVAPKIGQPVLWDPYQNISLAVGDIATAKNFTLSIPVKTTKGKTELVDVNGSDWDLCKDQISVTFTQPCCGVNQKVDQYIGCVKCDTGYQVEIHYRDAYTQAVHGGIGEVCWWFNYATRCVPDCDSCNVSTVTDFCVAAGLANEINSKKETHYVEGIGTMNTGDQFLFPLRAAALSRGKLFHKFCLSPQSDTCSNCSFVEGLVSLVLTTSNDPDPDTVVTIDLSGFTTDDKTNPEYMLKDLQEHLNSVLPEYKAFANISGGTGKCCQYEIEVGGCFDSAVLNTVNGPVPVTTENPFANPITFNDGCTSCTSTAISWEPQALIRYYTESIVAPCACDLPADNLNFRNHFKQIIDVQLIGDSWKPHYSHVNKVQNQVYPAGHGYYFLLDLGWQHRGGSGGDWYYNNLAESNYGRFPQHIPGHQFFESKYNIECDTSYCSMNIVAVKSGVSWHQNATISQQEAFTKLIIPITDSLTAASVKTVFDAIAAVGRCNWITGSCFEGNATATSTAIGNCLIDEDLVLGYTRQLTFINNPLSAPQVGVWTTSNAGVATVSSTGLVTPVSVGTATITFTASTGSSITDTCVVTVVADVATSASLANCLSGTPLAVLGTRQLTATVLPSGAPQAGTWATSDAGVATVSVGGLVTAVAAGTATITFTASTGTAVTTTCVITVPA